MVRFLLLAIIFLTVSLNGFSQKANFLEADKFSAEYFSRQLPTTVVLPNYVNNSDKFWYLLDDGKSRSFFLVDPDAGIKKMAFNNKYIASEASRLTNGHFHPDSLQIYKLNFMPDGISFKFWLSGINFIYNTELNTLQKDSDKRLMSQDIAIYPNQNSDPRYKYSVDRRYALYTKEFNLYLKKIGDSQSEDVQLTNDGVKNFSYTEFDSDTTSGVTHTKAEWMAGTQRVYVLRKDNRSVRQMYLLDNYDNPIPSLQTYLYALPGDKFVPQFELSIIDVASKNRLDVNLSKWKDQTIEVLYITKKGDKIYLSRKRRTNDEIDICSVNAITGEVKVVIHEECKPYLNGALFCTKFLNDGKEIVLHSERTGWGHFYLYDGNGKFKNVITKGAWVAGNIVKIDTLKREIYFNGYGKEKAGIPYENYLYKVRLDGSHFQLLTPEIANHQVQFSKSGKYFVDNFSRVDQAPAAVLRNADGKLVCELNKTDLTRLFNMGWKMPERFKVKAADGVTDLYGVMWKPFIFDPHKKYPIISVVYPGPQMDDQSFDFTSSDKDNVSLAQVGFIVVNIGHRGGIPTRSKAYRTFGYGNLRDFALADDKYGIEQLASKYTFIDTARVGIMGHSAGAAMSVAAICTYPDFYKVAVASSGDYDNNMYNQWWGESFQGVKEVYATNRDSLNVERRDTSFVFKMPTDVELVKNLKGHLLLFTGDTDNNVHPAMTMRLVNELVNQGKNFDMAVLPRQSHIYSGTSKYYYQRKTWYYFSKYLLNDSSADRFTQINGYK